MSSNVAGPFPSDRFFIFMHDFSDLVHNIFGVILSSLEVKNGRPTKISILRTFYNEFKTISQKPKLMLFRLRAA